MPRPFRSRPPSRWRRALTFVRAPAEAEGLAAGTGLFTGELVEGTNAVTAPCPECGGPGKVLVVDLVVGEVERRCETCGHSWVTREPASLRHTH